MIVLDASLAAAWLLEETEFEPSKTLVNRLASDAIVVPAHWPTELGNAVRRAVRTRRLQAGSVDSLFERLMLLDITVIAPIGKHEIGTLVHFALEHGLSVYDAAYLQLAASSRSALGTLDRAIIGAAKRVGVPLLDV